MKKRKSAAIPESILDDERISDSEFRLFVKFSLTFGTEKVKIYDSVLSALNIKKSTFYRLVKNLLECQYLQRNQDDGTYNISVSEMRQVSLNIEKIQSQNWDSEKEEERTKEEDKSIEQEYIYNNIIPKETENEKEREIKEREKDDAAPESEKPTAAEKSERFMAEYREIIGYLNEKTGKHYSARSRANQEHMSARLKEGRTVEDFKRVIDIKCFQWLDDPKMSQYLRPETLFSGKFDRYLNEEFKVTRKGPNGWEYTVTDEPDELDLIFGGGKHD